MDGVRFDRFARIVALRVSRRTAAKLVPGAVLATMATAQAASAQGDCPAGQVACRGFCTDLLSNPNFCGSCDTTCSTGACAEGVCVSCEEIGLNSCPSGDHFYCTDLQTDAYNCGACAEGSSENFCTSGVCVDGACVSTVDCESGLTECTGRCVDLMTDVSHCGGCHRECYGGESEPGICVDGGCVNCSELGLSFCPGTSPDSYDPYCADFATDPNNCGACDVVCSDGVCTDGACGSTAETPTDSPGEQPGPPAAGGEFADAADAIEFALFLDRLSLALLRHGLNTLPKDAFEAIAEGSRALLSAMRVHDKGHVALLTGLLEAQGGTLPSEPTYRFDSLDRADFLLPALRKVKEATVSAHLTILASIADAEIGGNLAGLMTVESRHAAILAHLVGITPFPNVADEAQPRDAILTGLQDLIGS